MLYAIVNYFDRILSYVYTRRLFGPRCDEHYPGCAVCDAWQTHDDIFN